MTHQAGTFQRVTVAEAAAMLGVSPATIRRKVKAGELTGERVLRPQGSAFIVLVPEHASAPPGDASATHQGAGVVERSNASPDASQETALAAWAVTLMAPLAEANQRQHETIVSQAERLEAQAETIGQLTEQVDGRRRELLRSTAELEQARRERDAAETSRRRDHRRLRIGLAVAGALVVAAGLAPGWVR